MKLIYIFLITIVSSVSAYCAETVWRRVDSPITVNHDETTLYVGDRLIIEPGVVVTTGTTVNGFARIRVQGGEIIAQGTSSDPIFLNSLYIQSYSNWESARGEFVNVVFNGGIGLTTRGHFNVRNCCFIDSELDARDSHYDFVVNHNAFIRSTLRLGSWEQGMPLINVEVKGNLLDRSILELPDNTGSTVNYDICSNSILNTSEVVCYRGSSGPQFSDEIIGNYWGTTNSATIEDLIYHDGDQSNGAFKPFFEFLPVLQNRHEETVKFYADTDILGDQDEDGLLGFQELISYSTSPILQDSDTDGVIDGVEITDGSNPSVFEINHFQIHSATHLSWASGSGVVYNVQHNANLNSNIWTTIPDPIVGNGSNSTFNIEEDNLPQFYRIIRN